MKTTLLLLSFLSLSLFAQDRLSTNAAIINFDASVPLFEKVTAVNEAVQLSFDTKTSLLSVVVPVSKFKFRLGLMQRHFNDIYLETHKFPKAYFKGKIQKFDLKDITETQKEYIIRGKLVVRGRAKDVEVKALVKRVGSTIQLVSDFPILLSDFLKSFPEKISNKINSTANTSLVAVFGNQQENRLIVSSK